MMDRALRRNTERETARVMGMKLRDLWGKRVPTRYLPARPKPRKYRPHQGKRECARRASKAALGVGE